jgi:tetratricopeptide (TPR) repeat protein
MAHDSCIRWLWLLILLLAAPAQAQDYKTHYNLAMALYQAQRFDDSIPEFKAAYDIDPKPGLLFNVAQAYRKAGKPREAIQYYDRYLSTESKLDNETRKRVDSYLAEARNTLAALELELKQRMAEEKAVRDSEPAPSLIEAPAPLPPPAPPPPKPVYKKWWFWTAIGGVAAIGLGVGIAFGTQNIVGVSGPRQSITLK